jgi:hypothetical protein
MSPVAQIAHDLEDLEKKWADRPAFKYWRSPSGPLVGPSTIRWVQILGSASERVQIG